MPPSYISEATNPRAHIERDVLDRRRPRLGGVLGLLGRQTGEFSSSSNFVDLDMNVAESYGIDWSTEKCGRDALQNFFDGNGGTLDGVTLELEEEASDQGGIYNVLINGDSNYDYRELTVIGATTKKTGEQTAGGFGEGAKFLALSLLRDHNVDRVVYRSRDWQLEFHIDDLPSDKVARPTRGLFARVATGLKRVEGSVMMISSRDRQVADELMGAKQLFRSPENPDFSDNTLVKTLPDGTQSGIKFLGARETRYSKDRVKGRLYIAGQRRHYSAYGREEGGWNTVDGLSVWTTKDIAAGDRDRGKITRDTLEKQLFVPLVSMMDETDVRMFFEGTKEQYDLFNGPSELSILGNLIAKRGGSLGVAIEFDPKYVAVRSFLSFDLRDTLASAGYVLVPGYFAEVGMKSDREVMRALHEHQRVEPSPEQQTRISILREALDAMLESGVLKKQIIPKDVWLFSKKDEKNPFEGTYDEEFVWVAEEHLGRAFPQVFATYLHELDHKHGTDQSAEFSYALTDTLAEVIHAMIANPELGQKLQSLAQRWQEVKVDSPEE